MNNIRMWYRKNISTKWMIVRTYRRAIRMSFMRNAKKLIRLAMNSLAYIMMFISLGLNILIVIYFAGVNIGGESIIRNIMPYRESVELYIESDETDYYHVIANTYSGAVDTNKWIEVNYIVEKKGERNLLIINSENKLVEMRKIEDDTKKIIIQIEEDEFIE